MQLNEWKAKVGAALVTPQLVLPKDDILTGNTTIADSIQQMPQRESRWRAAARWLAANPKVAFGLGIVGFFFLVAILGPLVIHHDPNAFSSDVLQPPSTTHWLGTTQTVQDAFAQVVHGTRVCVLPCVSAAVLATFISGTLSLRA